jgi:beta-galactosidase
MQRFPSVFAGFNGIAHGGDYNPEQWMDTHPGILDEDIRLMRLAGCNTFSVGIFAWCRYEPREGHYDFDWMDRILDTLADAGFQVALATPSAAKPAWLAHAHPETRQMNREGQRVPVGSRVRHCYASSLLRHKVAELNQRIAERYHQHPAVKLWHVSNEYLNDCFCPACFDAFRDFLRERHGNLDALNAAWWTDFWGHRFSDGSQIDPRDGSIDAMALDWRRFRTAQVVDFMRMEIAALRAGGATQPMTTNMMSLWPGLDFWRYAEHLDVISDDCYPQWKGDAGDVATAARYAFTHDVMRSFKGGRPWLLLESCPDSPQWHHPPRVKRGDIYRSEMLQALAHGADALMYFQWRKGRGGVEKFHGAVVDHEGSENGRVFRQVADLGRSLPVFASLAGCGSKAEVALLFDWESRWALDLNRGDSEGYAEGVIALHRGFWSRGIPTDALEARSDFSGYRVILSPQLFLLHPGVADRIRAFVEGGGTWVLTFQSAVVDENNLCFRGGCPGDGLRAFAGVWAEEVDFLAAQEQRQVNLDPNLLPGMAAQYTCSRLCEPLHAEGAETIGHYEGDLYDGRAAITRRRVGQGCIYYVGAWMEDAFWRDFAGALQRELRLRPAIDSELPPGVTAQVRGEGVQARIFVQNFSPEERIVQLDERAYRCAETGEPIGATLRLPPWQTRVLRG